MRGKSSVDSFQYSEAKGTHRVTERSRRRIVGEDDAAKSVSLMPAYDRSGTIVGLRIRRIGAGLITGRLASWND